MWIAFSNDFDWAPTGKTWLIAYKAGMRVNVTAEAGDAAIAAGAGQELATAPSRAEAERLAADPYWTA